MKKNQNESKSAENKMKGVKAPSVPNRAHTEMKSEDKAHVKNERKDKTQA